jgi:hypothetical protein
LTQPNGGENFRLRSRHKRGLPILGFLLKKKYWNLYDGGNLGGIVREESVKK